MEEVLLNLLSSIQNWKKNCWKKSSMTRPFNNNQLVFRIFKDQIMHDFQYFDESEEQWLCEVFRFVLMLRNVLRLELLLNMVLLLRLRFNQRFPTILTLDVYRDTVSGVECLLLISFHVSLKFFSIFELLRLSDFCFMVHWITDRVCIKLRFFKK